MQYVGRPGISPALAALIAAGEIRRGHRILDVGCGTGTDALLLARWGFRHVHGIDPDGESIRVARSRTTRFKLQRRLRFDVAAPETLSTLPQAKRYDIVLHTLVANNLQKGKDRHFRAVAHAMKPDGLLLLHERVAPSVENGRPGRFGPLTALRRHFRLSPGVSTHLAELATNRPGPSYARVVLWIGRPKRGRSEPA